MNSWRALWHAPRPVDVPGRTWRDGVLVAGYLVAIVLEAALRPDVVWRPAVTAAALMVAPALLWRRTHPLASALVGFGIALALTVAQLAGRVDGEIGLYSMIVVLVLLYALVRWGSGREIVVGLAVVLVSAVLGLGTATSDTAAGDAIGSAVILFAVVANAAVFRSRVDVRTRQLAEIRSDERVRLARELHDVVAHHVSAIAVQAQAGRAVAADRPDLAVQTLAVIEEEASRTLAEMRGMVRVLRAGTDPAYAPQPGVGDLSALARTAPSPTVTVTVADDLDAVPAAVESAIFRLAQESLTNALRHARNASRVDIVLTRHEHLVRLVVIDDGDPTWGRQPEIGYGLVGMEERVQLLGGSFSAGASEGRGWVVRAELPRPVATGGSAP